MERLVIDNERGRFYPGERTSDAIRHLGGFLCFDVSGSVDYFNKWIRDPEWIETGGNYSHVEKHGDKVTIEFEIDHFEETPNAPVFELTVDQMRYILDHWKEALEKRPNKIIITKDDHGAITVEFED